MCPGKTIRRNPAFQLFVGFDGPLCTSPLTATAEVQTARVTQYPVREGLPGLERASDPPTPAMKCPGWKHKPFRCTDEPGATSVTA